MPETRSVHIQLTRRFKLKLLLLLAAIVALQIVVFYFGSLYGAGRSGELGAQRRQLKSELNETSQALKQKSAELVKVSKSAEIDRLAAEQVRHELFELRAQTLSLQKDVEFYRGLLAPGEREKGLKLHALELSHDEGSDYYWFRLVLANIDGRGQVIKGEMGLKLQLIEGDSRRELEITDMAGYDGPKPIKLRFRFFQNIEGSFRLSNELKPTGLVVHTNVKDSSGRLFSASYSWQDLLEGNISGGSDVW